MVDPNEFSSSWEFDCLIIFFKTCIAFIQKNINQTEENSGIKASLKIQKQLNKQLTYFVINSKMPRRKDAKEYQRNRNSIRHF